MKLDSNQQISVKLDPNPRIARAAAKLASALVLVEQEALADARACPACGEWPIEDVDQPEPSPRFAHLRTCALDAALYEAGLR